MSTAHSDVISDEGGTRQGSELARAQTAPLLEHAAAVMRDVVAEDVALGVAERYTPKPHGGGAASSAS